MAATCQMRVSSYPQLIWRKLFTVSLEGEAAVKFAGSMGGNVGAAAGAGVAGSGAGGTFCWADATKLGMENATSATRMQRRAPAIRRDIRIKRILLRLWKAI